MISIKLQKGITKSIDWPRIISVAIIMTYSFYNTLNKHRVIHSKTLDTLFIGNNMQHSSLASQYKNNTNIISKNCRKRTVQTGRITIWNVYFD